MHCVTSPKSQLRIVRRVNAKNLTWKTSHNNLYTAQYNTPSRSLQLQLYADTTITTTHSSRTTQCQRPQIPLPLWHLNLSTRLYMACSHAGFANLHGTLRQTNNCTHTHTGVHDQPPHAAECAACYTNRPSLTGEPEAAIVLYRATVGRRYKASQQQPTKAHKHTMNTQADRL